MSYAHSALHSFVWLNHKLCLLSEGLIHHATNKWLIPILNSCNTYSLEESCCVAPVTDVCGSLWGREGSSLRAGRLSKLNALLSRARLLFCPTNNKSGVHEGEWSLNSLFPFSFINYRVTKKEKRALRRDFPDRKCRVHACFIMITSLWKHIHKGHHVVFQTVYVPVYNKKNL